MNHVTVTKTDAPAVAIEESLVPADQLEEFRRWVNQPVPGILYVAREAFLRDLPELLKEHDRELVAYHGERRIGISRDARPLLDICESLGLDRREVLIVGIHPSTFADIIA